MKTSLERIRLCPFFQRVAVDLVGPIQPVMDRCNRYILTLLDFVTRCPDAVLLKGIETEKVIEAVIVIICIIGIPKEMLTFKINI